MRLTAFFMYSIAFFKFNNQTKILICLLNVDDKEFVCQIFVFKGLKVTSVFLKFGCDHYQDKESSYPCSKVDCTRKIDRIESFFFFLKKLKADIF